MWLLVQLDLFIAESKVINITNTIQSCKNCNKTYTYNITGSPVVQKISKLCIKHCQVIKRMTNMCTSGAP